MTMDRNHSMQFVESTALSCFQTHIKRSLAISNASHAMHANAGTLTEAKHATTTHVAKHNALLAQPAGHNPLSQCCMAHKKNQTNSCGQE